MKRSTQRVLTSHAGSLPRPPEVLELVEGRDQREVRAQPGADDSIQRAVDEAVRKQVELGIDVPSDGEMGRVGFSTYLTERLTGFDGPLRPMQQLERSRYQEYFAD